MPFSISRDCSEPCCVCLEQPVVAITTHCGHLGCSRCLIQWQRYQNQACPVCRREIDNVETYLVEGTKSAIQSAQALGCQDPKAHLKKAVEYATIGLDVADPDLFLYLCRAEALLELKQSSDAIEDIKELFQKQQEREGFYQDHPVLGWMAHAKHSFETSKFDEARKYLEQAISNAETHGWPTLVPPRLQNAETAFMCGLLVAAEARLQLEDFSGALALFRKLLNLHLKQPRGNASLWTRVWKGLAICSFKLKAYHASNDAANRTIRLNKTASVYKYKVLSLLQLGHHSEALATLKQARLFEVAENEQTAKENQKLYRRLHRDLQARRSK